MKRLVGVIATSSLLVLVAAGTALATTKYPPEPSATHVVSGNSGTAFTGGNTSGVMIAIVALVAVGLVALFVARRRAAHAS
jgi:hypothetical protein